MYEYGRYRQNNFERYGYKKPRQFIVYRKSGSCLENDNGQQRQYDLIKRIESIHNSVVHIADQFVFEVCIISACIEKRRGGIDIRFAGKGTGRKRISILHGRYRQNNFERYGYKKPRQFMCVVGVRSVCRLSIIKFRSLPIPPQTIAPATSFQSRIS